MKKALLLLFIAFILFASSCTARTPVSADAPLGTQAKIEQFINFAHISREDYDNVVKEKQLLFLGKSGGYSICEYVKGGDLRIVDEKIGDYTFRSGFSHSPYPLGYYAIGEKEVYTLKQAYDAGVIDLNEVAGFAPTALSLIHISEPTRH